MANEIIVTLGVNDKALGELEKKAKVSGKNIGNTFEDALGGVESMFKKVAIAGGAAIVVFKGMQAALNASLLAEEVKSINAQFDILTHRAGIAGAALEEGLKKAADGLVDDTDLLQAANRAMIEFSGSAERLPEIFDIARKASSVFGGEITQNFEAINHAIATGSTKALKNLGIIIDSQKAYEVYAKSIGTTKDFLNEAGRQQAILNAVLEKGKSAFEGIDPSIKKNTESFQRLKVALGEVTEASAMAFDRNFGNIVNNTLQKLTGTVSRFTDFLQSNFGEGNKKAESTVRSLSREIETLEGRLAGKGGFHATTAEINEYTIRINKARAELQKFDSQNERSFMLAMKNQTAPSESAGADVIDFQKRKEARDAFNQELAKANATRIEDESRVATSTEQIARLNEEKRLLIEEEFRLKREEAKKKFLDTGAVNQAAFNNLEIQMEADKNARIEELNQAAAANMKKIKEIVQTNIVGGMTNAFASLGAALVKGKNGFEAFGKAVLSALGAMAIQIGSMLVSIGLGFAALGPILPPFGLSGAAAVAAGLGLIVLGGALSAMGGGGEGGAAAGGGGGGGLAASLDGGAAAATELQEPERTPPGTVVNLNVQGNVLDRRQTGLELAEVLKENFETNSVSIGALA